MAKPTRIATMALVAVMCMAGGLTLAQDQDAPRRGQRERPGRNADVERGERGERGQRPWRNFDPEQMQQRRAQMRERQMNMLKERLDVTDEEWQVIAPRIEQVQNLRQRQMGMVMGMRGRRGGGPGAQAQGPDRELTGSALHLRQLRELVQNENAPQQDIREALNQLRESRQREQAELRAAQDSLRELLTLQQEASLVAFGVLD